MGNEQSQSSGNLDHRNYISFLINGKEYISRLSFLLQAENNVTWPCRINKIALISLDTVNSEKDKIGCETMLVDYIRDHAHLKGTKFMCREGGCGTCMVSVKTKNIHTGMETIRAVNSCLIPVFACDGWEISTVESLGNKNQGYHPLQQRFVKFHGTQCGFCTPGWVMNFYSVIQSKKEISVADIEDVTDSNICRCTGYRPILDAVKSLAIDAPEDLRRKCVDMPPCRTKSSEKIREDFERLESRMPAILQDASNSHWVTATDMKTLFEAINRFRSSGYNYRIVAGNTGTGVYKTDGPYQAYVELNGVHQLQKIEMGTYTSTVIIGGAVTISAAMEALASFSTSPGFEYCKAICKHWKRVANISVRNVGTLGGNLMLKHKHPEFSSDIFLILEAIGASLTISSSPSLQEKRSPQDFLKSNMTGKVIYSIHFPKLDQVRFRSFKITRRYQSSHSYVNAAFLMRVDSNMRVTKKPAIVYGGISPDFVHAFKTEEFLNGKTLNNETLKGAMETLEHEINPDVNPPEGIKDYRKKLTQGLLYKFIVGLLGDAAEARIKSCSADIERGPTHGKQSYEFDKSEAPLYEPVTKLEAPIQCSGEITYTNDVAYAPTELHAAIVLTTVSKATIKSVDTSEAMKVPGVVAWVDYKDIKGENNYMVGSGSKPDLIFVQDEIHYAGQPIGAIVAETRDIAQRAKKLVKVEYEINSKPMVNIKMALKAAGDKLPITASYSSINPNRKTLKAAPHNISGEISLEGQFHFPMETHVCICVPREEEMEVHCATQCVDFLNRQVASCLAMPRNSVTVFVRRLGGAFGNKINRSAQTATICALSANKVGLPVRLCLDMETNMHMFRGRLPYLLKYEAGFDDDGKLSKIDVQFHEDTGCTANEFVHYLGPLCLQNVYSAESMTANLIIVNTDLPPNTFCRAPGIGQALACMETVMDHIAYVLKKDPVEVRLVNLLKEGDAMYPDSSHKFEEENMIPKMLEDLKTTGDIDERQKFIESFNAENRWKKRGLAIMPCRFFVHYLFSDYKVYVSVFGTDGSVSVSHSGIEMGQGMNTKLAQIVARKLGIALNMIKFHPMNSLFGANATFTGSGATTDHLCHSAVKACEILLERMAPVKEKLENPTWLEWVAECKKLGMDLTGSYVTTYADQCKPYGVWGISATELEIDCLTGEYRIIRVDLTSDCGQSLSPDLDVGQIEGAFIMGMGWLLSEKIMHDEKTGELITNRTWNYKPPTAKDIPGDFRVTLLRNARNPLGVLGAKSTGEAPFILSVSVFLAMRKAISSARMDAGNSEWFQMDAPLTPEDIQRLCLTDVSQFVLQSSKKEE